MIFTGRIVQIPYRTSSSSHNAVDIREVLRRVAARVSIRPLLVTALWIGLVQMSYADSTVVSGDNQTATVNSPLPQPLVGSVTCDGTCTVTWSSSAGDTFSPASEVISVVEGPVTVSTIVTLSGTPGTRTITLQDSQQGVRATFTATAVASPTPTPTSTPIPSSAPTPIPTISPLSGLSGLTPNQKSVAAALDSACPNATGALEQRCRQLYSAALSDAEKIAAIGQITPEQIAAQTTQFLRVGTNRMINIEHRLTALRHGAKGSQITFNADGKSIPFGKLARSLHNTKGGNAGDNPDDPFRDSPLGKR